MSKPPQFETWEYINTKIARIIPNDRIVDNAKLDEILDLYKDYCDTWLGYFGSTFIKPQQSNGIPAKGTQYGQLHLENLIFSDEFSILNLSKKLENLQTISFGNCTFKEGFHFDRTTLVYFQKSCILEKGIVTNTVDIVRNVSGQQTNFASKIIFDLPDKTELDSFIIQSDNRQGSELSKFLADYQDLTFKNIQCADITLTRLAKSFNFINCNISNLIIKNYMKSCPKSLIISRCEINELFFLNEKGEREITSMDAQIQIINNSEISCLYCSNLELMQSFIISDSTFIITDLSSNNFKGAFYVKNAKFESSPNFLESKFTNNTIFEECKFKDTSSANSVIKYRFLKNMVHGIGDEHQASIFQALEFKARRKNLKFFKGDALEKTYSLFLCAFHNYGMTLLRPYIWLILFGGIFYNIYNSNAGIECTGDLENLKGWLSASCATANYSDRALYATFANSFGPIGIIIKNSTLVASTFMMKIAETVQMIFSSILWTIIITSARRRFKV